MTKKKSAAAISIAFFSFILLGIIRGFVFSGEWFSQLSFIPYTAVSVISWWISLIPVLALMKWDKTTLSDLGFVKEKALRQVLLGLAAGIILAAAMTGVLRLFGVLNFMMGRGNLAVLAFLINGFFDILTVGLAEEAVFRGYIFKKLLDVKDSRLNAIILSSVLFGLFHLINIPYSGIIMTLIQVGITALLGFIFCMAREKLKGFNMLSLIIFHAIYDAALPFFTAVFGR